MPMVGDPYIYRCTPRQTGIGVGVGVVSGSPSGG